MCEKQLRQSQVYRIKYTLICKKNCIWETIASCIISNISFQCKEFRWKGNAIACNVGIMIHILDTAKVTLARKDFRYLHATIFIYIWAVKVSIFHITISRHYILSERAKTEGHFSSPGWRLLSRVWQEKRLLQTYPLYSDGKWYFILSWQNVSGKNYW